MEIMDEVNRETKAVKISEAGRVLHSSRGTQALKSSHLLQYER